MTLSKGQVFPDAQLSVMGPDGPALVSLADKLKGRKVIVFGLPGAFTGTCSTTHLPSFMRVSKALAEKGVEEIICVSVNDPFVLDAWDKATGASAGGVTLMGDATGALTRELGMAFDAPAIGLTGRSNRYAALVEDGVVTQVNIDEPGVCDISTGERFLEAI
ncbi:MAG: redoxin family protein [Limimaricola sp.]|uniref:peroxiredoxin n=1 Tax=Limimaricola sp. TaxID=2211665 RepID=UPI001E0D8C60|nr:peroxiredoxin [Limimaricola sp.]MBI1418730.1 redoxin family protein [Limimaricola sp.]